MNKECITLPGDSDRLDRELSKLTVEDVEIEKSLADEGLTSEADQWPAY